MSAARLSSISSQTLSQILERQRLHSLGKTPPPSQLVNVTRNLEVLRDGILNLERQLVEAQHDAGGSGGSGSGGEIAAMQTSASALRNQWERAKRMLGDDGKDIEDLPPVRRPESPTRTGTPPRRGNRIDAPYTDSPPLPASPAFEPAEEMTVQRQMMDEQDTHLETLSHSIRRQREISENIGSELDVHTGLLEDLEVGLDRTAGRLGGARRRLETVGRGARENFSAVTIAILILALLILIVIFKT